MERFLDSLFDGVKTLEGRVLPRGWSAAVVLAFVLFSAVVLTAIAFLAT